MRVEFDYEHGDEHGDGFDVVLVPDVTAEQHRWLVEAQDGWLPATDQITLQARVTRVDAVPRPRVFQAAGVRNVRGGGR